MRVRPSPSEVRLPQSIIDKAELPAAEDLLLYILRHKLPDLPTFSLIPEDPPEFFAVVRKVNPWGPPSSTWTDVAEVRCNISSFTADPNGDSAGQILSEAIRVALREAWRENFHVPGLGWINHVRLIAEGTRVSDWATSAGPVQYADLPTGYWRYESSYELKFRREP